MTTDDTGLLERLAVGPILCAEGYLFELERRGYVSAGPFVPEVVMEHPEAVEQLHRDFLRSGSDVVEAFTYYAHREKLRLIDKEDVLEEMNREAIRIAKRVADSGGALLAGNICNTNVFIPGDGASQREVRSMFAEQVAWAVDEGVDFIIGETFDWFGEAQIACEVIAEAGLPAVITLAIHREAMLRDEVSPAESCARLEDAGAAVVGLNCMRGPETLLPLLAAICDTVSCPVAALPVPYRTTADQPTFQALRDPSCELIPDDRPFPTALDPFTCNRYEIAEFTRRARELGVQYLGLCCGGAPHLLRSMAEALGRRPPASKFSPDMSKHAFYGDDETLKNENLAYAERL